MKMKLNPGSIALAGLVLATMLVPVAAANAQQAPAQSQASTTPPQATTPQATSSQASTQQDSETDSQGIPLLPKADVFVAYSFLAPYGSVDGFSYHDIVPGFIYGGEYFFDRRVHRKVGVIFEGGYHRSNPCENCIYTLEAGPVMQKFKYGIDWGVYTMLGGARVSGPNVPSVGGNSFYANPPTWGFVWTLGGRADYLLPKSKGHVSVRLVDLEYHFIRVNFGPQQATTGGIANINALQVSAGLVYRWNFHKMDCDSMMHSSDSAR